MNYRESADALLSKLDDYFRNENILHEVEPTLQKLQLAEAKQRDLVKRVEELKNLLTKKDDQIKEVRDESRLLLKELHFVQEELEKCFYAYRTQDSIIAKYKYQYDTVVALMLRLIG